MMQTRLEFVWEERDEQSERPAPCGRDHLQ